MTRTVESRLANDKPDVVVISQVQNFPLLEDVAFKEPVILDQFEVGTIWNRADSARGYQKLTRALTRSIWSHYLSEHLSAIDGITVPSESERDILIGLLSESDHSNQRVVLIPNGIDEEYFTYPSVKNVAPTLIYQGSLKFAANLDAMEFFLSEIMPLIQESVPNIILRITGRYDGVDLSRIKCHSSVELTGYLDDVSGAVSAANVCIIPLRYGSGTRIKALESMALGTPVVSTTKGIEGIDVVDGVHVSIADEPELFAKQVICLLADADHGEELAMNARRLVLEKYNWTQLGKKFSDFCVSVYQREQ
jgi:glycosyltransferase involved in cell wall biosynthesis